MRIFFGVLPFAFLLMFFSSCNKNGNELDFSQYERLKSGFADPKGTSRAKVYWWWLNGNMDTVRMKQELNAISKAGLGGVDIFEIGFRPDGVMPAGPPFMGKESLQSIAFAIREATRLNLEVGLNLASSWNAGGTWITAEHSAKSLYVSKTNVSGGQKNVRIPFPTVDKVDRRGRPLLIEFASDGKPVYRQEIAVLAIPVNSSAQHLDTTKIINVSRFLDSEKDVLHWEVPQGEWEIHRFVCSSSGEQLKLPSPNSAGPIIDHFDSAATLAHFMYFIEQLKPVIGDFTQTALKNFYLASFEATGTVWTPTLSRTFKKINGYDVDKFLPQLFNKSAFDSVTTEGFERDFQLTLSELMINNHYKKGKEIANKYGLNLISESGGPGPPLHNVPLEGLKALGALDVPRGEFWINHSRLDETPDSIDLLMLVKEISAASHIYQRKITELEAFTSFQNWQEGPGDMRPIGDRAFMEGMNRAVIHGFTHNPEGTGFPGIGYYAGTHYNDKTTWWPKAKPFNDYLARISYVLQETEFVADVLYYYGDKVPNFVTPKNTRFAVGSGYDYEVINSEILLKDLSVKDGLLTLPYGAQFKVLALGEIHGKDPAVLKKLQSLIELGAVITGPKPLKAFGESRSLADALWDNGRIQTNFPLEILQSKKIVPDFDYPDKGSERLDYQHHSQPLLEYTHYKKGDLDFYFIRNVHGKQTSRVCSFRQQDKAPELWDPVTGKIIPVTIYQQKEGVIDIPLSFAPYGSYFIVFTKENGKPHYTEVKSERHPPMLEYTSEGLVFQETGTYTLLSDSKEENVQQSVHSITVDGAWEVSFNKEWGGPESITFPSLTSWTTSDNEGIKYYSGSATYAKTFTYQQGEDGREYLDLGEVAKVADVWLNDHHLGITWTKPFRYDVTKFIQPGENNLRIEVINTWSNRIIGDLTTKKKFTKTNLTQRGSRELLWNETPLLKSGLLGPVTIREMK